MVYIPTEKSDDGVTKVIYTSKDRKSSKVFTALDWFARLVTHIPGRYEHPEFFFSGKVLYFYSILHNSTLSVFTEKLTLIHFFVNFIRSVFQNSSTRY